MTNSLPRLFWSRQPTFFEDLSKPISVEHDRHPLSRGGVRVYRLAKPANSPEASSKELIKTSFFTRIRSPAAGILATRSSSSE